MKTLIMAVATTIVFFSIAHAEENFVDYGYAIKVEFVRFDKQEGKNVNTTGHGTGTAVDLTEFGLKGNRYILTAAHVVTEEDAIGPLNILVAVPDVGLIKATLVKKDMDLDIAIIEVKIDLPKLAKLDTDKELPNGTEIINVGCPEAIPPKAFPGKILEKRSMGYLADIPGFYHGNSGGGVFRKSTGLLTGVAISGLPSDTDPLGMERGKGIFTPTRLVRFWLMGN